jgi:hypothetical protein
LAEHDEDLASSAGQHGPIAEHAAGPSSGTADDAAVQRVAATDDAGASLEPKHDHARGAGREPVAGDDEEQQCAAQHQEEEPQRAAQQQEEEQQREAQRVNASVAGRGTGAAIAAATTNEAATGGCNEPVPKQARRQPTRARWRNTTKTSRAARGSTDL